MGKREIRLRHCTQRGRRGEGHEELDESLFDVFEAADAWRPDRATYNAGVAAYERGDIEEATRLFARAVSESDSESDDAWAARHNLGICLVQNGDVHAGVHQLELVSKGDDWRPLKNLAVARWMLGDLDGARAAIRRAIELKPGDDYLWYRLSTIEDEAGNMDAAIEAMRRAVEAEPGSCAAADNLGVLLQRAGRLDEAIAAYRRAIELEPEHPLPHYNLASALWQMDRLGEAEAAYRRHMELDAEHSCPLRDLGEVYMLMGRHDEALGLLRRYAELEPEDGRWRVTAARAHIKAERLDEAGLILNEALRLDPADDHAMYLMGQVRLYESRYEEALAAFDAVLAVAPQSTWSRMYRAQALIQLDRMDEALQAIKGASGPNAEEAWIWVLRWASEKGAAAIPLCREAASQFPEQTWALGRRGEQLWAAGHAGEAAEVAERCLRIDPDLRPAMRLLGSSLNRLSRFVEALPHLSCAHALEPSHVEGAEELLFALARSGRRREALSLARRLAAEHPDRPYAVGMVKRLSGWLGVIWWLAARPR